MPIFTFFYVWEVTFMSPPCHLVVVSIFATIIVLFATINATTIQVFSSLSVMTFRDGAPQLLI